MPLGVYAMQRPVFSSINVSFNQFGTRYIGFEGGTSGVNSNAFAGGALPQSSAGMVSNLTVQLVTPPGAGKSHVITLYRNNVATALTCTISDTSGSCADNTHTVPYLPGDLLAWQQVPAGTPAASNGVINASDTHGIADEVSFGGGGTIVSNTAYNYFPPYGGSAFTVEASSSAIMPVAGTLTKLYGQLALAAGAGTSYNIYVNKNGATTTVTCNVGGASTLQCSDVVHTVSFAAGDTISVHTEPVGSPAARQVFYGFAYKPTTDGEAPLWVRGAVLTNGTRFNAIVGATQDTTLENLSSTTVGIDYSLKNIYASIDAAPGGVTTRTFALRINGATQALSATITSAATTASDIANTIAVSANQFVNWVTSVSGSPAAVSLVKMSMATFIAPPTGITVIDTTSGSAASGTAVSCTKPAGTASGDVVIATINFNSGSAVLSDNNGATPFTKDYTSPNYGTANVYVFSRYAGGSEPSTYNFTSNTNDRWTVICTTFRDVDRTSKYDVAPSNSTFSYTGGAGGATATTTAITTLTAKALVYSVSSIDTGTQTLATVMPGDSFVGLNEISTNQPQNAIYKIISTSQTQASVTWNYGVTVLPGVTTFALRPAINSSPITDSKFNIFRGSFNIFGGSFRIQ